MNNPTPRDSAQLPPLTFADWLKRESPAGCVSDMEMGWNAAREALRAQAASVEPIGEFVDGCIVWSKPGSPIPPNGTKLYAGAPPAHIPADDWHLRSRVQDLLHLLSFAEITTPSPGDKPEAEKAMADLRAMLNKPQAVAASSPATAVDAGKALMAAERALCLPCDRWNKTQALIVNEALAKVRAALAARAGRVAAPAMVPCAYRLDQTTTIESVSQPEGGVKWAVRRSGDCLSKDGYFVYEPLPSSRGPEFMALCRFETAEEAASFFNGLTVGGIQASGGAE